MDGNFFFIILKTNGNWIKIKLYRKSYKLLLNSKQYYVYKYTVTTSIC